MVGHRADEPDEEGVPARSGLEELALVVVDRDVDGAVQDLSRERRPRDDFVLVQPGSLSLK